MLISSVGIQQDDLLKTIAPDLIQHSLDEFHEQGWFNGDSTGKAARLVDLPEVEGWEDDRLLLLSCQAGDGVPGKGIGAQGQVGAMALDHTHGNDTHAGCSHSEGEFI